MPFQHLVSTGHSVPKQELGGTLASLCFSLTCLPPPCHPWQAASSLCSRQDFAGSEGSEIGQSSRARRGERLTPGCLKSLCFGIPLLCLLFPGPRARIPPRLHVTLLPDVESVQHLKRRTSECFLEQNPSIPWVPSLPDSSEPMHDPYSPITQTWPPSPLAVRWCSSGYLC